MVHAPDGRYAQSFEVADIMPLGPHVGRIQLTNYERIARPSTYMHEIQARPCTSMLIPQGTAVLQ
jgi:hypothetical protein